MVAKPNFEEKPIFVIVFSEIRYSLLQNLKIFFGQNLPGYLQPSYRKSKTKNNQKTISFNFSC